jgi:small subunit ribosomal protein S16
MSVKIRLQRHGKKGKPFYWVVAADARSKRDGKYLEKIGTYNPNTNPATIDLNLDSAVKWLHNGAQPTDTAKAILSYKGALLKHHLDGGIRKGALTQEQADAKLAAWLEAKSGKVDAKKEGLSKAQADAKKKAFKAEQDVNAKRLANAAQAEADAIAAESAVEVEEEAPAVEAEVEEVEETVAEVEEIPTAEVVAEETPIAEVEVEETVAEIEETPATEDSSVSEEADQNNEEAQA